MPQKVAIYIRVSTQEQAQEGYSIGAQTDRLTAYCKAKDWPIADVYTDAGFSGSNMQRPALQRLVEDVNSGSIDAVLVYKLDRLSRSQKDTLTIIEDILLKNGVAFVSISENFDTSTPLGRAMIGILSVFAQLEREQIKERMSIGKLERAKAGLWHGGGNRPFGYDYIDGKLIPNELEALAVREVYERFIAGATFVELLAMLQTKYGLTERKQPAVVKSILTTRVYLGEVVWMGEVYKGQHQPLIDELTFKRVQSILEKSGFFEAKPNPFQATSLFGAVLVCSQCGMNYMIKGNHSGHPPNVVYRPYYVCKTKAGRGYSGKACAGHNYAKVKLDAYLIGEIHRLVEKPRLVDEIARRPQKKKKDTAAAQKAAIMKKIDGIDNQIRRVVDLYQLGTIKIQDIGERTQKLQAEKAVLEKTLKELTIPAEQELLPVSAAKEILSKFDTVMASDDQAAKQQIIRQLIKKIIVLPDKNQFDIIWNF